MTAAGADTAPIDAFIRALCDGSSIEIALAHCAVPAGSQAFVSKTFEFIESGKPHIIAAAFTFGREEPIPGMFRKLVGSLAQRQTGTLEHSCFISTGISSSTRTTMDRWPSRCSPNSAAMKSNAGTKPRKPPFGAVRPLEFVEHRDE